MHMHDCADTGYANYFVWSCRYILKCFNKALLYIWVDMVDLSESVFLGVQFHFDLIQWMTFRLSCLKGYHEEIVLLNQSHLPSSRGGNVKWIKLNLMINGSIPYYRNLDACFKNFLVVSILLVVFTCLHSVHFWLYIRLANDMVD